MKNLLRNILLVVFVYSLLVTSVIPVSAASRMSIVTPVANEQLVITPEQMGPFLNPAVDIDRRAWGTRAYYDNDRPVFSTRSVYRRELGVAIGTAPQVKGGLQNYVLGDDEEWFAITESILVMTATWGNNLYIGYIQVGEIVLRDKKTKKIKAIKRCGNWAREIGARYVYVECTTANPGPCKSDPQGPTERFRETETLSNGDTVEVVIVSDDCKTEITKTITKIEMRKEPCIPGQAFTHVQTWGPYAKGSKTFQGTTVYGDVVDTNLKDNESFKVLEVLSQIDAKYLAAWNAKGYGDVKVKYLRMTQDRCPNADGTYNVWVEGFGVEDKGRNWFQRNWKWLLIVAAGAITVISIRGGSKKSTEALKTVTPGVSQPTRPKIIN